MTLRELKNYINNNMLEKMSDDMAFYSYDLDKVNEEFKDFESKILINPDEYYLYINRGYLYYSLEDFENSIKEMKKGLAIIKEIYEKEIKERKLLNDNQKKEIESELDLWDELNGLGMIYYKARDYENSVEAYSNAMKVYNNYEFLGHRGKSFLMLNRLEDALNDWSNALDMNCLMFRDEYESYYSKLLEIRKNIDYQYLFTDERDGQYYRIEKMGNQLWMADNFNYNIDGSTEYTIETFLDKKKYGRYYDWETAQLACPKGWRLPTKEDYYKLFRYINDDDKLGHKLVESGDSGFDALYLGCRTKNSLKPQLYAEIFDGDKEKNLQIEKEWKIYKNIWGLHKNANFWTSSKENDKFPFQLIISDEGLLNSIKTQKKRYSKMVYLAKLSKYNLIQLEVAFEQKHPCHGINVRYVKDIK